LRSLRELSARNGRQGEKVSRARTQKEKGQPLGRASSLNGDSDPERTEMPNETARGNHHDLGDDLVTHVEVSALSNGRACDDLIKQSPRSVTAKRASANPKAALNRLFFCV